MPETAGSTTPSTRTVTLALVSLLLVAAAWGSSFPLTKALLGHMSALSFLAVRFTMAGALLLVLLHRAVRALPRRLVGRGLLLGLAYGVAQIVQTVGLERTSASVSGFITGLYVVLTPLCAAVLLRTRVSGRVWVGAGLATVGLGLLALNGLAKGSGELLTLLSALIYALHIVGLGAWSTARAALGLAAVQLAATGGVCLITTLLVDPSAIVLPSGPGQWAAFAFLVVVSGAAAMIIQSWAQAHLAPSRAAIVMSTEPAWAAGFSIAFLDDPLTWRIGLGGLLMLVSMVVVETAPRNPGDPHPEELPKLAA